MTQWCKPVTEVLQDPRSGEKVDKQLWVTRKGATSAQKGQYGIIPGSMGVGSFITQANPRCPVPFVMALHNTPSVGFRVKHTKLRDDCVVNINVCMTPCLPLPCTPDLNSLVVW